MTVIPKPAVELMVDERLAGDAELVRQLEAGLLYLEQFYNRTPPPKAVRVRPATEDHRLIELALTDDPTDESTWVRRNIWAAWFRDPLRRDLSISRSFHTLLDQRYDTIRAATDRLLAEYESEEVADAEAHAQ